MAATASITYISASANRFSRTGDAPTSSLVAFGSGKYVAFWDVLGKDERAVSQTLPGHEGSVTCVKFINGDERQLLSADDKGALRFWEQTGGKWSTSCSVQAHQKSISAINALGGCVVTGSSDGRIAAFELSVYDKQPGAQLKETQRLDLKGVFPLDIELAYLPGTKCIVMAIASTERKIGIWTRSGDSFIKAASLPGHEDWIKCLDFELGIAGPNILTLASGSRDGTIRLWNIESLAPKSDPSEERRADDLLDAFEASLGNIAEGEEGGRQISMKTHMITVKNEDGSTQKFAITFDALLVGHEAGVTSLSWRRNHNVEGDEDDKTPPTLLSTSTDSSVILWSPTPVATSATIGTSSLWVNQQRFGDIGGQRLGGFVGGLWCNDGGDVVAWGWNGGWRRWSCRGRNKTVGLEEWQEVGAITGHSNSVKNVCWSPRGEYLISTSHDQTTRIHANTQSDNSEKPEVWHEIARPQVHGYDIVGAVALNKLQFVSIADEKVVRAFTAPRGFVSLAKKLKVFGDTESEESRPLGASVPPLGLSNKAHAQGEVAAVIEANYWDRIPFEGELAAVTLWPEIEKVFGHGYELLSLAASNSGRFIATSCKATTPEHAVIRVYDTEKWQLVGQPLAGHSLSITRIAFSPDDKYILSVSRDRSWHLFEFGDGGANPVAVAPKAHARIIWDAAWAYEGDVFVTAARDKTVKIWKLDDVIQKGQKPIATIKTEEAATAVSFTPQGERDSRLLAVGLETGVITIYSSQGESPQTWDLLFQVDQSLSHIDHIHRLAWRPSNPVRSSAQRSHQLASCSEDGTVKLITISTNI